MCTNVKEIISHCHSLTIWNIREYSRCWSLFTWDGTGISTQQIFLMALYLSSLEVGQMTTIHCTFGAKKWNLHLGLRTNLQLSHCNTCRFTNKYSPPYSEAKSISEKIPAGKVGLLNLLYRKKLDRLYNSNRTRNALHTDGLMLSLRLLDKVSTRSSWSSQQVGLLHWIPICLQHCCIELMNSDALPASLFTKITVQFLRSTAVRTLLRVASLLQSAWGPAIQV